MPFVKAVVEGVGKLLDQLRQRRNDSRRKDQASYTVGYSAPYAVFVHEDLEARHEQGQAKFLEQPARTQRQQLGQQVQASARKGLSVSQATENAALHLLAASQELVPVSTGVLKASGYVKDDRGNTIAGSDLTPAEARAWQALLQRQQQEKKSSPS